MLDCNPLDMARFLLYSSKKLANIPCSMLDLPFQKPTMVVVKSEIRIQLRPSRCVWIGLPCNAMGVIFEKAFKHLEVMALLRPMQKISSLMVCCYTIVEHAPPPLDFYFAVPLRLVPFGSKRSLQKGSIIFNRLKEHYARKTFAGTLLNFLGQECSENSGLDLCTTRYVFK